MLRRVPVAKVLPKHVMMIALEGHLFDSGLINQVLDVVEKYHCGLNLQECAFPDSTIAGLKGKSSVVLCIKATESDILATVEQKMYALVQAIESADATMKRVDQAGNNSEYVTLAKVEASKKEQRVLLLGAGMVSKAIDNPMHRPSLQLRSMEYP
jgi:alpha-aminoadipic semialdehyde synthase